MNDTVDNIMDSIIDRIVDIDKLKSTIKWATVKPPDIEKKKGITMAQQKRIAQDNEKKWGNQIINQKDNGQWTTLLGEGLIYKILKLKGENPRNIERI